MVPGEKRSVQVSYLAAIVGVVTVINIGAQWISSSLVRAGTDADFQANISARVAAIEAWPSQRGFLLPGADSRLEVVERHMQELQRSMGQLAGKLDALTNMLGRNPTPRDYSPQLWRPRDEPIPDESVQLNVGD